MAIYEFTCTGKDCTSFVIERRLNNFAEAQEQFCEECGSQLQLTPSRPASFPVGKYGKGNR